MKSSLLSKKLEFISIFMILLCLAGIIFVVLRHSPNTPEEMPEDIDSTTITVDSSEIAIDPLDTINYCEQSSNFGFYFWKTRAYWTPEIDSILNHFRISTLYLHYFDVDLTEDMQSKYNDGVYPVYLLRMVEEPFKRYNIVPVIFITNRAIEAADIEKLSTKIIDLTNQISVHHFQDSLKTVQIDCDWTESTQEKYFMLLKLLGEKFTVETTIRLHQVKFKERTGVPPVTRGTLMLYNVGNLKDEKENSILQADIVGKYIDESTSYPIDLDIALPLHKQTVIQNTDKSLQLVNTINTETLSDKHYFKKLTDNLYEAVKDTFYESSFIHAGTKLKTDNVTESDMLETYHIVKHSKLNFDKVLFYHLEQSIIDFNTLDTMKAIAE